MYMQHMSGTACLWHGADLNSWGAHTVTGSPWCSLGRNWVPSEPCTASMWGALQLLMDVWFCQTSVSQILLMLCSPAALPFAFYGMTALACVFWRTEIEAQGGGGGGGGVGGGGEGGGGGGWREEVKDVARLKG